MSLPRHMPTNQGELELYKVLQRANVLQYYDTFIEQGGDDVRQLCEAGEDEFLEIMALVGMASKPLHVRRLQKALQEWLRAPGALLQHAPGPPLGTIGTAPVPASGLKALTTAPVQHLHHHQQQQQSRTPMMNGHRTLMSVPVSHTTVRGLSSSPQARSPCQQLEGVNKPLVVSRTGQVVLKQELARSPSSLSETCIENRVNGTNSPVPCGLSLTETQLKSIREAASELIQSKPPFDFKTPSSKKALNQRLQELLQLPMHDESRLNGIRKYSAIYGRFDSKRKCDKPMALYELLVNEAAAQLCHLAPELLTRRDELFPLAREVVRNSGNPYIHGSYSDDESPAAKRCKTEIRSDAVSAGKDLDHMQQEILSDIVRDVNVLDTELDKVRQRIELAENSGDLVVEQTLLQDLNALVTRRQQLIDQQNVLLGITHSASLYLKSTADDSDTSHSLVSSPRDSNQGDDDRELDLSLNNRHTNDSMDREDRPVTQQLQVGGGEEGSTPPGSSDQSTSQQDSPSSL